MRVLALLISTLLAHSVVAEPKRLVCSYTDPRGLETTDSLLPNVDKIGTIYLPIGAQIGSANYFCSEYPDNDRYCGQAKMLREFRDTGACQNLGYLSRYNFMIDTSDLNTTDESNAEFYADTCGRLWIVGPWQVGVSSSDVEQVTMTATPSVIRFSGAGSKMIFNIDRKTLKSGYGTDRSWQCKIEDVDLSQNAI